jgi:hypothetical protein
VGVLEDATILKTLVAALDHKSPYCVVAAAACLGPIALFREGVRAFLKAGDVVPALVRVIARARPPADLEKESPLYQRCVPEHIFSKEERGFTHRKAHAETNPG